MEDLSYIIDILVNRIKININNTKSRNTFEERSYFLGTGNKLTQPLPATIKYGKMDLL
jgi:hypothetical protein